MKPKNEKNLIVGLDVGTSKIVAIVGEHSPGEAVEIIGIGSHPAHGLKRGVPQAEGLAIDDQGVLYLVSEPNLFYRFAKPQRADQALRVLTP